MRKNFNTFIMNHMKLVNFIFSILYLALFLILFIVVKHPIEDGMKASLADGYYRGIKYSIYKYHSFQVWVFFILESLGLLGNVLLILYLIIISLFNKRIIKLLSILSFSSIVFLLLPFIYGILYIFMPFLILCPILFIIIIALLIVNLKYIKYEENLHEKNI